MDEEASKPETHLSKKRKVAEKTVVRVRREGSLGTQARAPPSDPWSWRKYGQKPIKGSPFPRGYYRCSTSKGCSAKKQVERCKTDESVLVITYSSSHNHQDPSKTPIAKKKVFEEQGDEDQEDYKLPGAVEKNTDERFNYLDQTGDHFFSITEAETVAMNCGRGNSMGLVVLEEEDEGAALPRRTVGEFTKKTEEELMDMENDFFDELEELFPTTTYTHVSSFKSILFKETVYS